MQERLQCRSRESLTPPPGAIISQICRGQRLPATAAKPGNNQSFTYPSKPTGKCCSHGRACPLRRVSPCGSKRGRWWERLDTARRLQGPTVVATALCRREPATTNHFLLLTRNQGYYGLGRGRGVGLDLGVALGVAVGVVVAVAVAVGVALGVAVGVTVGVTVGVGVGLGVGVGVTVAVGVAVGVGVGVAVGVTVGVGV